MNIWISEWRQDHLFFVSADKGFVLCLLFALLGIIDWCIYLLLHVKAFLLHSVFWFDIIYFSLLLVGLCLNGRSIVVLKLKCFVCGPKSLCVTSPLAPKNVFMQPLLPLLCLFYDGFFFTFVTLVLTFFFFFFQVLTFFFFEVSFLSRLWTVRLYVLQATDC